MSAPNIPLLGRLLWHATRIFIQDADAWSEGPTCAWGAANQSLKKLTHKYGNDALHQLTKEMGLSKSDDLALLERSIVESVIQRLAEGIPGYESIAAEREQWWDDFNDEQMADYEWRMLEQYGEN